MARKNELHRKKQTLHQIRPLKKKHVTQEMKIKENLTMLFTEAVEWRYYVEKRCPYKFGKIQMKSTPVSEESLF